MIEIKQTETFRKWRMQLKDERVRGLIASRLDRLGFGHAGDVEPVGKELANCASIMVLDIASISRNEATRSSFCCAGAIRVHKQKILRRQNAWLRNGVNEMAEKLTTYDPAEDLASDEAMATFLAEAFETSDASYIAHALGVVARAKGMAHIAGQTGLSREQLYRSFSENGNPTLKTTLAVMRALGLDLTAKVHA
jgi:probable addiction module antidote protein